MTKFKAGDVVEWRGNKYTVKGYTRIMIAKNENDEFVEFDTADDISTGIDFTIKIKESFAYIAYRQARVVDSNELTLTQIAKKFNIPVDKLRIKEDK